LTARLQERSPLAFRGSKWFQMVGGTKEVTALGTIRRETEKTKHQKIEEKKTKWIIKRIIECQREKTTNWGRDGGENKTGGA